MIDLAQTHPELPLKFGDEIVLSESWGGEEKMGVLLGIDHNDTPLGASLAITVDSDGNGAVWGASFYKRCNWLEPYKSYEWEWFHVDSVISFNGIRYTSNLISILATLEKEVH